MYVILSCLLNVLVLFVLFMCRNDGMEDRYSVVIRLVDQLSSDGFYCCYNGKRFRQSEVLEMSF